MKYYEKKRREFEAEQFIATSKEQNGEERRLLGLPWRVHGVGPNVTLRMYGVQGNAVKIYHTDWVVRDTEGRLSCVTDAEFKERFETGEVKKSEPVTAKKEA